MSKLINIICAFCLVTIAMAFQCKKEVYTDPPKQDFLEKIKLSPAKKVYNIGDTIWISFTTQDKSLYDAISNQRLPTHAVRFLFGATLIPLDNTPLNPLGSLGDFIVSNGLTANIFSNPSGSSISWYLGCDNSQRYDIRLGVSVKYQGTYLLEVSFRRSDIEPCSNQNNPYPNSSILFTFDLPDTNKDVYLTIPQSKRIDPLYERQVDSKVGYAFKVQ